MEVDLSTTLPFTLSAPKPYFMAYTPHHQIRYVRVFKEDSQIIVCRVTQVKSLSTTVKLVIESNETITEPTQILMIKKIRYELGLDEDLKPYIHLGRQDRIYRRYLSAYPGFRLCANSEITEATILTIIAQHSSFPEFIQNTTNFIQKYGEPVPWDTSLHLFPEISVISDMSIDNWKSLHINMGAKYLAKLDEDVLEDVETFTYYPIFERGLRNLQNLPGIGRTSSRILMVYAARRYHKAIYTEYVRQILESEYNLTFKSIASFDKWIEKIYPNNPAFMFHPILLNHLPAFRFDYDFS